MTLEQRAASLFPGQTQHQAAWVRIVTLLGPKWLLAQPQPRKSK